MNKLLILSVDGRDLSAGDVLRLERFQTDPQRCEIMQISEVYHVMGKGSMRDVTLRDVVTGETERRTLDNFHLRYYEVCAGAKIERVVADQRLAKQSASGRLIWRA